MIWLTWRQARAQAAMMAAALALLAAILALTGPNLADDYSSGIAACTTESGGCSRFVQQFFQDHHGPFLAVTAVVLVLPALIGLFWGAPLIARELEAGTHRLVWNQTITRTRWLAVKLGLVGLAAITAAGLGSLAVTWWSDPIDKTAVNDFPRMAPLLFDARGIVPIGYAAFAFALGVTVGMLVRRALPAMAITLAVFIAVQIAMPLLVRPHLIAPKRSTIEITASNLDGLRGRPGTGPTEAILRAPDTGALTGAWLLSSQAIDASGHASDTIPLSGVGACAQPQRGPAQQPVGAKPGAELSACFAEMKRLGYRQQLTYQPASRFWAFQWYETGIYTALALALSGFCFWRLRHRLS
jgi:ABC-type transport system involved in multi-copper enzyme maturation permease subunit